jgi:hypothetical protein
MIVAVERAGEQNIPLFLHVAGAMVLVGGVVAVLWMLFKAWRSNEGGLTRTAFRTLLYVVIPSFIVMRAGAQWIYDKQGLDAAKKDPAWIGIGFGTSDASALLLIVATVLAGLGARRLRRDPGARPTLGRVAVFFTLIPLLAFLVTIWAMTTKPA